jgi:pyruvate, orthophosphate dikinase
MHLFIAALVDTLKDNRRPNPDVTIMIPFVFSEFELELCLDLIKRIWIRIWEKEELKIEGVPFKLGAILEVPRACLVADKLAAIKDVDVLAFSAKELTELSFGVMQEISGEFMVSWFDLLCDLNMFIFLLF